MVYPVLSFQPDFTQPPQRRVAYGFDLLSGMAKSVLAFPETRDEIVTAWRWAGMSDAEKALFAGFFDLMGGTAGIFFMPTWQRDFELAAMPAAGDAVLSVLGSGYDTAYLATTYPDRPGRFIYLFCPVNGFHCSRVLRAVDSGSLSLLTLEQPVPFTAEPGTMTGWLLASRFEADDISFQHANEQFWLCDMPIRTLRIAMDATRQIKLDMPPQTLLWKAPSRCSQELKPASRIVNNYAFAKGPETLGGHSDSRPATTWAAWQGTDGVYLAQRSDLDPWTITDGDGVKSALIATCPNTPHLSLAFDENGDEVLAIARNNEQTVSVHGRVAGVPKVFTFDGFSPQLFQFWTIDNEAYDKSDAEIVCIYLKRGTAGIYGRFESEAFGTEHLIAGCPNVPIRIEYVSVSGVEVSIGCIDDCQREMILYADYSYTTQPIYGTLIDNQTFFHTEFYEGFSLRQQTILTVYTGVTYIDVPDHTDGNGNIVYRGTPVEAIRTGLTYSIVTDPVTLATLIVDTIEHSTHYTVLNTTH